MNVPGKGNAFSEIDNNNSKNTSNFNNYMTTCPSTNQDSDQSPKKVKPNNNKPPKNLFTKLKSPKKYNDMPVIPSK